MAEDGAEEKPGTLKRVQLLRTSGGGRGDRMFGESTAQTTANLSKKLTGFDQDSLERLDAVRIGLQKLPEISGNLIDRLDMQRLSSEINKLRWTLQNCVQSFQEDLLDEAEDIIFDVEDSINESSKFQRFGRKSAEYRFAGIHTSRSKDEDKASKPKLKSKEMKSKIELLLAKIQICNNLLPDRVVPIQSLRFWGRPVDPMIVGKNLINLENVWEYEVNSLLGIEESKKELISQVLGGGEEFKIIGIFGMGGVGKTTLAKAVYQDISVRQHFDCFAWVRVGDRFRFRRVLEDILISVSCHELEEMVTYTNLELAEILYNFLERKRYLIVLDDVWDKDAWDCLNISFPTSKEMGSRLLLTTRCDEVVHRITASATVFVHEVKGLSEQQGLDLLFMTAFRCQRPDLKDEPKLIEVATQIIRVCSGIPLMVKLVGGILTSKPTILEWKMVYQNIVLSQNQGMEGETSILNLAYDSLPYYLKPCFLCSAMFPKGVEGKAKSLYTVWLAEGLVVPGKMSITEIAERYMYELHVRSMVSVRKSEVTNALRFKSYHLHDLLHDLCIMKQKESNFCTSLHPGDTYVENLGPSSSPNSPDRISRLALYFEDGSFVPLELKKINTPESVPINSAFNKLRQSIQFHKLTDFGEVSRIKGLYLRASNSGWRPASVNPFHFLTSVDLAMLFNLGAFERLRLLDCDGFDLLRLKSVMDKLRRLRRLNLRNCNLEHLPSTISNLSNLQTLYLPKYSRKRLVIPSELQYLTGLMFLYLPHRFEVQGGGKLQFNRLINLEELVNFDSEVCEVKGLLSLKKLKTLVATLNGNSEDLTEINRSVETKWIPFLSLFIRMPECNPKENHPVVVEDIWRLPNLGVLRLEGFMGKLPRCFSHSLKKLFFSGSNFDEDPMGKLEKLPNLLVLKIYDNAVVTKDMTCSELGMPQLRHLALSKLEKLEKLAVKKGGMPHLSSLVLERCRRLKDVPEGLSFLTSLQELKVSNMPPVFVDRLNKLGECLTRDRPAYAIRTNQLF